MTDVYRANHFAPLRDCVLSRDNMLQDFEIKMLLKTFGLSSGMEVYSSQFVNNRTHDMNVDERYNGFKEHFGAKTARKD